MSGDLRVDDRGDGAPVLLLHGGGGPASVLGLAALLADAGMRVLTPTMPGFDGTVRPAGCDTPADVAARYLELLDELDLREVTVVGSSAGGWVAAETALRRPERLAGLVLVNAVGILVEGHPITDVSGMTLDRLADYSFHDPDRFRVDPATLPPAAQAAMAANAAVFAHYAGEPYMHDPTLRGRLAGIRLPVLVAWGESDRVVDLDYGRAYAAAIPDARFVVVERAGHPPHMEQPEVTRDVVVGFSPPGARTSPAGPPPRRDRSAP